MFTMVVRDAGGAIVATGASIDGETWEQVLLRLLLPGQQAGPSALRIIHTDRDGTSNTIVIVGHRDGSGRLVTNLPLHVRTDPPQP